MTTAEIEDATNRIQSDVANFEYNRVYQRIQDKTQLIDLYKSVKSGYEKIQLYRLINYGRFADTVFKKFIDEAYHVENDLLFQLNPTEYPLIPEYIINLCDSGICEIERQMV